MAIADDLTAILEIKQNIKTSLENKGLNPTNDFSTYANLINNISAGLTIGTQKTCNISYNYQSTLLANPVTLPSSEPSLPQVSYTIQPGYFPTLTGSLPASVGYCGGVFAGGINNNTSTLILNWRVKRNGVSIANGSQPINANNRWCLNALCLRGLNKPIIGDIIDIFLWCTSNNLDLIYNRSALAIIPVNFKPVDNPTALLLNTNLVTNQITKPSDFTASPSYVNAVIFKYFQNNMLDINNSTYSFKYDSEHLDYGIFTNAIESQNASNTVKIHATNYIVDPFTIATEVSWQETNISYMG